MSVENTQIFQEDRSKYKDFREMLADPLSQDEIGVLNDRYKDDCDGISGETQELCSNLRKEVDQYKEMTQMGYSEIKKLQKFLQLPKSEQDGLRGPTTYAQYQAFADAIGNDSGPKNLIESYDSIFQRAEDYFNSLDSVNREKVQKLVGAGIDGKYGPNTFGKICKAVYTNKDLKVFFYSGIPFVPKTQETQEVKLKEIPQKKKPSQQLPTAIKIEVQDIPVVEEVTTEIQGGEDPQDKLVDAKRGKEDNDINPEELKSKLKLEARNYSHSLILQLQASLEDIGIDGVFGNESATRILEKYPEITDLESVFAIEGINTDVDGVLSQSKDIRVLQENFENLYGEYIETIGDDLGLPNGFIQAIIRKETTYGSALNSPTGSKGMMQLTKWPFKDMRGDHGEKIGVDSAKVRRYQEVFRKIDIDKLLGVKVGEESTAVDKIPSHVVEHLRTIQSSENIAEIQTSITSLYKHIKGNKYEYDHETNMIIGSVYLAYQYDRNDNDIWLTARKYNGDKKIAPNGKQTRTNYANTVQRYYNELNN